MYLVAMMRGAADQRPNWFLVPVGDTRFDETARAVDIDVPACERIPFDPGEWLILDNDRVAMAAH